eukprot:g7324.t1
MRRSANRLATTAGTHAAAGQTTALQFCGPCQYITNESDAEEVCRKILRNNDVKVIGVDAEWNMTYRKNHRQHVALLQFAYEDNSLLARYSWPAEVRKKHASLERKMQVKLFHLRHFAHFPASLRRILEADDILKVGVNVKGDCTRMVRGGFIDVPEGKPAWLDTEKLARRKVLLQQAARLPAEVNLCAAPAIAEPENLQAEQGGEEDASPLSSAAAPAPGGGPRLSDFTLASLCGYFYQGVPLEKERRVRCSNWEQLPLTASQQKYAATDAATHLSTYWALQELEDLPESAIIAAGNRGGRGSGSVGAMRGGAIFNMHAMVARRSPAHCAGAVAENLAEDEIAAGDAAPDTHDAEQEQPASSPPLYFRPRVPQELLAKIAGENQQDAPKLRRIEVEACLDTRMPADFFSADYSGAEREHPSGNKADPAQARPQGYTLGEACRELQLKPATLESYLTKAMISGKEYIWGPHLGVSDETLQVLVDALGSDGRALPSNQTFLENAGLDSTQANLALLHLKRLVDAGSYDEISRAVPALDPKKLEAKLWSIRRAKTWFHFAPRPSKSKNHLQNMAPVQVASSPRAGHVVVPAAI